MSNLYGSYLENSMYMSGYAKVEIAAHSRMGALLGTELPFNIISDLYWGQNGR